MSSNRWRRNIHKKRKTERKFTLPSAKSFLKAPLFKRIALVTTIIVSILLAMASFSILWMNKTWSALSMDELMYTLNSPIKGTDKGMVLNYLLSCLLPTILIMGILLFTMIKFKKRNLSSKIAGGVFAVFLLITSVLFGYTWDKIDAGAYFAGNGTYSTFVEDNYVNPGETQIQFPEEKRNLIYIFLESMETTYADVENGGGYEENYIPNLTKLAQENENFSGSSDKLNGGHSMKGTTWTIGAMFAETAGLPLSVMSGRNNMDMQSTFFEDVTALGDILEEQGYNQSLLIGSDAVFGGRKLYFTTHGNYNIFDYYYAKDVNWIEDGYKVFWGYEDVKLFENAKEKLTEIAAEGEPFNFTMLTVDTHFEDGYVCEICGEEHGEDQYANVISCSDRQVLAFVEWIKSQPFYENTTVVIAGDHPTMDSDFCEEIDESAERKVYVNYLNSAVEYQGTEERFYSTFDLFPTTVASLGASIEGNRLGLGSNLYSDVPTLLENYGIEAVNNELGKQSKLLENLANEYTYMEPSMSAELCDNDSEYFYVYADDMDDYAKIADDVHAVVWTGEHQEDIQWISMNKAISQDGIRYFTRVDTKAFIEPEGEYTIHFYITDDGRKRMLQSMKVTFDKSLKVDLGTVTEDSKGSSTSKK